MPTLTTAAWSLQDSIDLYRIEEWGRGYFTTSAKGEVVAQLGAKGEHAISLLDVIHGLEERGIQAPVLVRIPDLLYNQINRLNQTFQRAINHNQYQGNYRGVYPIKVNQQQQVLEEISLHSKELNFGLEAGSKAEIIAALAHLKEADTLLICNGYKDEEFIELALYATKLGLRCVIVVETLKEIDTIIHSSQKLDIRPIIGLRVKLSTRGGGHWTQTGGDSSVFGLNTAQIVEVVEQLQQADMLDCLQLLHYHLGSQIPDIQDIRKSVFEACRIYAGLVKEGAPMSMLDIGGGLAVDYDGSSSTACSSRNYNLDEYCNDIVDIVKNVMDETHIAHPTIVTESGRATVAYYSVLIFNILDISSYHLEPLHKDKQEHHPLIANILEVENSLLHENPLHHCQEAVNDAYYYRDEVRQLFKHGVVNLRERALAEKCFWNILQRVHQYTRELAYEDIPENCRELATTLCDIYYSNFSLFQSLPDSWAINQLFPIMPIHRLHEEPTRNAIISDITCDCDGRIDRFISQEGSSDTIRLHPLQDKEEYYLAAFLVGAYQETLGDLHNLLGDTNVVSIQADENGELDFVRELEGDSVADVLSYVEYNPKEMISQFRKIAENAVQNKRITVKERRDIVEAYIKGMQGYTYHEKE